jgi:predicted nucleotidyltransferase
MDFARLLRLLTAHNVDFIIIGGIAAVIHGSARATYDLDVVYSREAANVERIVEALADVSPYLRGAPSGLPFRLDARTIAAGLNFTLTTTAGDIDLLGEVAGAGSYIELLPSTIEVDLFGVSCRCVNLSQLIVLKRAAGRPRDLEVIAELQALQDEHNPPKA